MITFSLFLTDSIMFKPTMFRCLRFYTKSSLMFNVRIKFNFGNSQNWTSNNYFLTTVYRVSHIFINTLLVQYVQSIKKVSTSHISSKWNINAHSRIFCRVYYWWYNGRSKLRGIWSLDMFDTAVVTALWLAYSSSTVSYRMLCVPVWSGLTFAWLLLWKAGSIVSIKWVLGYELILLKSATISGGVCLGFALSLAVL